jgi:hypothetical protein
LALCADAIVGISIPTPPTPSTMANIQVFFMGISFGR